jgi:hypothetical protein
MIAALALAAALAQSSLLQKVIPRVTGQNGYEEYIQAAILIDRPEARALEKYVASRAKGGTTTLRPAGIPENATLLDVYRFDVKALAPALELIRAGNEKRVTYPHSPVTANTLFPELSEFRIAARLFARSAYVAFAGGDSKAGTQALLDGLVYSRKIQCLGTIHLFVGRSCEQTMFGALGRHVDQISYGDSEKLMSWADSVQDSKEIFAWTAKVEQGVYRATFDDFCANPDEYKSLLGGNTEELRAAGNSAKGLSGARKEALYSFIARHFESSWIELQDRLQKPESEWLQPLADPPELGLDPLKQQVNGDAAAALVLLTAAFSELGSRHRDIPATLARYLIQERLAGIYAAVIRYRWRNNALPAKLADVFGKEPVDPVTEQPYTFERVDKSFRVTCKAGELGDVGLVYAGTKPDPQEIDPS